MAIDQWEHVYPGLYDMHMPSRLRQMRVNRMKLTSQHYDCR